jgi:hypothetical protein
MRAVARLAIAWQAALGQSDKKVLQRRRPIPFSADNTDELGTCHAATWLASGLARLRHARTGKVFSMV